MNEKENLINLYQKVKSKGTFIYLKELENFKDGEFYKFYLFLRANRQVISILRYNYNQLIKSVNYHNSPENQSKVWNEANPKYRWRQQRIITSQLFNYLTSVFATVDYSRGQLKKYIALNPEVANNFKLSAEAHFDKNLQHKFIQGLRNYTSHNSYLRVATELKSRSHANEVERRVYLLKEDLLNSDKWSGLSKDFLSSSDAKIYIIDIIESHFPLFKEFQDWTYLALLQVDPKFTSEFRTKLVDMLEFAEKVNMARTSLPYNRAYIRYLDQIIKESTFRCNSQFKYAPPIPQV